MIKSALSPTSLHTNSVSEVKNSAKRALSSPTSEQGLKRPRSWRLIPSNSSNPLACCHCHQSFSGLFALQRHETTVHDRARPFRCQDCKRSFSRKDTFDRHRAIHTKAGFASCPGCRKKMRPDYLPEHLSKKKNRGCILAQPSSSSPLVATSSDDLVQNDGTAKGETNFLDDANGVQVPESNQADLKSTNNLKDEDAAFDEISIFIDGSASISDTFTICEDPALPSSSHSSDAAALASVLAFSATSNDSSGTSLAVDAVPLRSDPLLFKCDDDDREHLSESAREELRQWYELKSRAARTPAKDQSSVGRQVRKHLCNIRSGVKRRPILGATCDVCGVSFGSLNESVISHAKSHLRHRTHPRFECTKCNIEFVFERDFKLHCQRRTNSSFATECEQLNGTIAGIWINEAIADKFVQDLHLWEKFQISEYVDQILASMDPCLSRKQSAASLPDRWSDSSRAVNRQSITSYKSYTSSARLRRSDMAALTERLENVVLDEDISLCGISDRVLNRTNLASHCPGANSPMMKAFRMGRLDLLLGILRNKMPHICNVCERYTLCSACMEGRTEVVLALMNAGVDPRAQGPAALPYRPLDLAMMRDRTDIVKLLLKMGASAGSHHASYFMRAATLGDTSTMECMIGAGFEACSTVGQETVLLLSAKKGYGSAIKVLLDAGANFRITDNKGFSPLHHASKEGHVLVVRHLLDAGADADAYVSGLTDLHGTTPLMLACSHGRVGVVGMLLARRVKVNIEDTLGRTALHYTCEAKTIPDSDAIAHQLLVAGANIDYQDVSAMTPLMYASSSGNLSVVQTLIFWGANLGARAHSGLNALMRAKMFNQRSIAKLLETWMGNHLEP